MCRDRRNAQMVDHAREHNTEKRGGGQAKLPLDEALFFTSEKSNELIALIALDEALNRLEQVDQRQGRIIKPRFFGGLSVEETAEIMAISPRTVKREWRIARVWLHHEISRGTP